MKPNIYIYILVMAGVTYLIRMLPLALFKKEITSPRTALFFFAGGMITARNMP